MVHLALAWYACRADKLQALGSTDATIFSQTFLLHTLSQHPRVADKLRAELKTLGDRPS